MSRQFVCPLCRRFVWLSVGSFGFLLVCCVSCRFFFFFFSLFVISLFIFSSLSLSFSVHLLACLHRVPVCESWERAVCVLLVFLFSLLFWGGGGPAGAGVFFLCCSSSLQGGVALNPCPPFCPFLLPPVPPCRGRVPLFPSVPSSLPSFFFQSFFFRECIAEEFWQLFRASLKCSNFLGERIAKGASAKGPAQRKSSEGVKTNSTFFVFEDFRTGQKNRNCQEASKIFFDVFRQSSRGTNFPAPLGGL